MYNGFRLVGKLQSIGEQRLLQRLALENILGSYARGVVSFLDVGVGDGRELDLLMGSKNVAQRIGTLTALDIDDWFTHAIDDLPNLSRMTKRIRFVLGHAENLLTIAEKSSFGVVHCSFLCHELAFGEPKRQAVSACFDAIVPGGFLLYADAFLDNEPSKNPVTERARRDEVASLYRHYLREAQDCRDSGDLSEEHFNELCGDATGLGLLSSMEAAVKAEDDYYEPLGRCVDRLVNAGFVRLRVLPNSYNKWLYVIVAEKPTEGK